MVGIIDKQQLKQPRKLSHWHLPFRISAQIELADVRDDIEVQAEIPLGMQQPIADVVVVLLKDNIVPQSNFAQIFRKYNVFEYKSPSDRLTVKDFHKSAAYVHLYCNTFGAKYKEITLSLVTQRYPKAVISYLKSQGFTIQQTHDEIYRVGGNPFPIQFLVTRELNPKINPIIQRLRTDLTPAEFIDVNETIEKNNMSELATELIKTLIAANNNLAEDIAMSQDERIKKNLQNAGIWKIAVAEGQFLTLKVQNMLRAGAAYDEIAEETGLSHDEIEKIAIKTTSIDIQTTLKVQNMLQAGASFEDIAEKTGLSFDDIELIATETSSLLSRA